MSTEYIGIHKGLQKALKVVTDKEGKKAIRQAINEHRDARLVATGVIKKKTVKKAVPPKKPGK